jgi:myo-inositol-1(or 4)-monophosphatase
MSLYCVNLAFVQADEVIAAMVADPSTSEIVIAERDRGAWILKGDRLHCIRTSALSHMIVVEDGKSTGARRNQAAAFSTAAIRADRWDFRSLGTTLSLPYLAAGRIAANVLFSISAVHSAAGSLLVTEAGDVPSDIDRQPWMIDSPTCSPAPVRSSTTIFWSWLPRGSGTPTYAGSATSTTIESGVSPRKTWREGSGTP